MARILGITILGSSHRARSIEFVLEKGLGSPMRVREPLKRKKASQAYESEGSKENKAANKIGIGT